MKNLFFLVAFLLAANAFGQTDSINKSRWVAECVSGFNVSQVSLTNWTQGGDASFSWTVFGNFGLIYTDSTWKFTNNLKAAYGMTKLGNSDYKSNDNELFLESVLSYKANWAVDPYFCNTVRTVVANGYDYSQATPVRIAGIFDPGYINQSAGLSYDKIKNFICRLGIGFQETFTNKFRKYSDDPETTNKMEAFKFETGIESVTEASYTIADNLLHSTKLRLFGTFKHIDVWDVRWDNNITAKVNKYLNVNLNVLILYEKAQSPKTQIKEALQVGLRYNLF
jgi:hypothetical protein